MPCFAGLDASKRLTHICVVDAAGMVVKQGSVPTEPRAIVGFLRGDRLRYVRVESRRCP
jgi:hypothetical protein